MMMSLLLLFSAILVGAIAPGISFIFVAQTTLRFSKRAGIFSAIGMGLGSVLYFLLVLLGLQLLFDTVPMLFPVIKVAGALYLLYVAFSLWKAAGKNLNMDIGNDTQKPSDLMLVLKGFLIQISNPKTALFYGSVIVSTLPEGMSVGIQFMACVGVFIIETLWYSVIALTLSTSMFKVLYIQFQKQIDRISGGIIAVLGLSLLKSNTA